MANLIPYGSPSPSRIIEDLAILARFETEYNFLRKIEATYEYPSHSCSFEEVKVQRPALNREVPVTCLVLGSDHALTDEETAIAILQDWMCFRNLDYYRLAAPDHNGSAKMLLYEASDESGIYWARDQGRDPEDFGPLNLRPFEWEDAISQIKEIALKLDSELILTPTKDEATLLGR